MQGYSVVRDDAVWGSDVTSSSSAGDRRMAVVFAVALSTINVNRKGTNMLLQGIYHFISVNICTTLVYNVLYEWLFKSMHKFQSSEMYIRVFLPLDSLQV